MKPRLASALMALPALTVILLAAGGVPVLAAQGVNAGQGGAADGVVLQGIALFSQSLVIFLREGAEAVLVIAALWVVLSGLKATGRAYRALLGGAGAGLAVSAVVGLALAHWLAGAKEIAELVEGVTLLLAAAVLLFVSSWLLGQRHARQWQARLRDETRRAFTERGLLALSLVGFLAVFREGAETVLFLVALSTAEQASWPPLVMGGLAAALILVLAFFAVRGFGLRLPLRAFFTFTSWSLLALAIIYAGQGVHGLQEAGLLPETILPAMPRVKALGFHPSMETFAAQFITLSLGLFLNLRAPRVRRASVKAAE